MAIDFDQFPFNDVLVKPKSLTMSDEWTAFMATFYQTLISYLSQYGMFLPVLTTDQRKTIQSPQEGQMIYNSTLLAPQIYQNGAWKTFTTS